MRDLAVVLLTLVILGTGVLVRRIVLWQMIRKLEEHQDHVHVNLSSVTGYGDYATESDGTMYDDIVDTYGGTGMSPGGVSFVAPPEERRRAVGVALPGAGKKGRFRRG